jgi:OOP family OmpA-OmpF porin
MRVFGLLAAASLVFAHTAAAQQASGGYMGFALGVLDYEEDEESLGISISDSTSAYRILGGYRFTDNFAVEGGWGATGDIEETFSEVIPGFGTLTANIKGDYEILTVRALGIVPFDKLSLLGGVGYYDADLTVSASVSGFGQFEVEDSDSGATLVGGLQFELERLDIRAELEWFDTDSNIDVWDASIGVLFKFR